jgi:alpha-beta hydrolase superfamily lysophospholipase
VVLAQLKEGDVFGEMKRADPAGLPRVGIFSKMHEERLTLRCSTGPGPHLFVRRAPSPLTPARPALLVCPGFIQNRKAFDLPGRSLLGHLTDAGFDVYALELAKHRRHSGEGLSHYTDHAARVALEHVLARHEHVGWVGHSMGGLIGVGLPSALSARLFAMIALGSPLKPGPGIAALSGLRLALARVGGQLRTSGRPFRGGQIAAGFHRSRLLLDHPVARFPLQVWSPRHLSHEELAWALSNSFVDDSWGAFSDLVDLAVSDGERAGGVPFGERLRALSPPLFVVGADRDGLAPPPSTRALYERAGSADKELILVGRESSGACFGHIDLLVGRRSPLSVWAPMTRFLADRLLKGALGSGEPRPLAPAQPGTAPLPLGLARPPDAA